MLEGIGINDADYPTQWFNEDGKRRKCRFMSRWQNLFRRVYNKNALRKEPNYVGCSIDVRWHKFMDFRAWMSTKNWENMELDKDIIVPGNKIYGPDTCAFVPSYINTLFCARLGRERNFLIGVTYANASKGVALTNPFVARVTSNNSCKLLGLFPSELDAHRAWQLGKINAIDMALLDYSKETCFIKDIEEGILLRKDKIFQDYNHNRITEWL